jgi:hypothetical protein
MLQKTFAEAPEMSAGWLSDKTYVVAKEDFTTGKLVTGATPTVWLEFTSRITWPGPEYHLIGGPVEERRRLGVRGFAHDSIKIEFPKAFDLAWKRLKETNAGDKFASRVDLYWVLYPGAKEPLYQFTTNLHSVISVGAYTGEVNGP